MPPTIPLPGNGGNGDYVAEASRQDQLLDDRLADIRRRQDARVITVRQAADLRVAAFEHHLEAVRALRAEFFGSSQ